MYQYNACSEGAADIQRDRVATAIQGAYYTAYWNNAKHPKTLDAILDRIYKNKSTHQADVDVSAFLEKQRRFEERGGFEKRNQSNQL